MNMNVQIIDLENPLWPKTLQKLRHDVYHLPEYVYLESKRTQTSPGAVLIHDGDKILFVPYLLRQCHNLLSQDLGTEEVYDVVSPYGYPGILLSTEAFDTNGFPGFALNELQQILKSHNVCSAFFRMHPILGHAFQETFQPDTFTENGETVSVDLTLTEPQIWAHTRKGHQSTINKCKRSGLNVRIVPFAEYLDEFTDIYQETMNRVEASQMYFFDSKYFMDLLNLGNNLHLCIVELKDKVICASLFFECCGIVQAHLGGTRTDYLRYSPFNLLLHYVRLWAKERGNQFLHLGGGIGGSKEDKLHTFKSGFSRQRHDFLTLRLVTDKEKYTHLLNQRAKVLKKPVEELLNSNFFPAYRASS